MALIRNNLNRGLLDAVLGQPVFSLTTTDRDDSFFQFVTTPLVDGEAVEVETIIIGQGCRQIRFCRARDDV